MFKTQQQRLFALMCFVSLVFGLMMFVASGPSLGLFVASLPFIFLSAPKGFVISVYKLSEIKESKHKKPTLTSIRNAGFTKVKESNGEFEIWSEDKDFSAYVKVSSLGDIIASRSENKLLEGRMQPRSSNGIFSLFIDIVIGSAKEEIFFQDVLWKIRNID